MDWREKYKDKLASADDAVKCIRSNDVVVVGQINGISSLINKAMEQRAEELENVSVFSSLGYKYEPYLDEKYRGHFVHRAWFLYPNSRKSYLNGMTQYTPMFFHEYPRYLREVVKPDVAVVMVSEPDENNNCSFSMNADFIFEAAKQAREVILHINKYMPRTYGSTIHLDDCHYIVEEPEQLVELVMGRAGEIEEKIAYHITPYIEDGATLQLGIGGLPDFVLTLLHDKKDLGIHTEVFGNGLVDLYEKGVITNAKKNIDKGKIVSTCMFGGQKLANFAHENKDLLIKPVDYTNDPYIIAQNDNVVSINACLEIDLLGQVNADTMQGTPYSGIGGQVDFIRGAKMSKGGKSFLAMPSTAKKGEISRIVTRLGPGSPVTTSRFDVDYVVTEYGVVRLWGLTVKERIKALISISHPDFREQLEREAFEAGWMK